MTTKNQTDTEFNKFVTNIGENDTSFATNVGLKVPGRIEHHMPHNFRIAVYPDGREELQAAYQWHQGSLSGVDWKPVPKVLVDE